MAKDKVSKKISKLVKEGKPQKQAVAIALDMQRRGKLQMGGPVRNTGSSPLGFEEFLHREPMSFRVETTQPFSDDPAVLITDPRKTRATTGKTIDPNRDLKAGSYSPSIVKSIIAASLRHGVDPYTALAVGLAETNLGKDSGDNVFHVLEVYENPDTFKTSPGDVDVGVSTLKANLERGREMFGEDEEKVLQTFNGLGKVVPSTEEDYHGFKMKSIYGVPLGEDGINLSENPLYGKNVIDLRDNVLKKNPNIRKLVEGFTNKDIKHYEDNIVNSGRNVELMFDQRLPGTVRRLQNQGFTVGKPRSFNKSSQHMKNPKDTFQFGGMNLSPELTGLLDGLLGGTGGFNQGRRFAGSVDPATDIEPYRMNPFQGFIAQQGGVAGTQGATLGSSFRMPSSFLIDGQSAGLEGLMTPGGGLGDMQYGGFSDRDGDPNAPVLGQDYIYHQYLDGSRQRRDILPETNNIIKNRIRQQQLAAPGGIRMINSNPQQGGFFRGLGDALLSGVGMPNVIRNSGFDNKAPEWLQKTLATGSKIADTVLSVIPVTAPIAWAANAAKAGINAAVNSKDGQQDPMAGIGGGQPFYGGGLGGFNPYAGLNMGVGQSGSSYQSGSLLQGIQPNLNLNGLMGGLQSQQPLLANIIPEHEKTGFQLGGLAGASTFLSGNPQGRANPFSDMGQPQTGISLSNFNAPNGGSQLPQMGGFLQGLMGYRDDSPFKGLPFMDIPGGDITMNGVSQPLGLFPDRGRPVIAPPNSGNYQFPGAKRVTEVPLQRAASQFQSGGMSLNPIAPNPMNWFTNPGHVMNTTPPASDIEGEYDFSEFSDKELDAAFQAFKNLKKASKDKSDMGTMEHAVNIRFGKTQEEGPAYDMFKNAESSIYAHQMARAINVERAKRGLKPMKFQMGGQAQLAPIQTEKGEMLIHLDGTITDVHAKKKHTGMDDDHVTDIVPQGTYTTSDDRSIKMAYKEADEMLLAVKTYPYKEHEKGKEPEEITFADLWPGMSKKSYTPAQIAKMIARKFKTVDKGDHMDIFTKDTNRTNIESRIPYIYRLMEFNESQKDEDGLPIFQKGGTVRVPGVPKHQWADWANVAVQAIPGIVSLFGGKNKGGGGGGAGGQYAMDPMARSFILGSAPLHQLGLNQNIRAQQGAYDTALSDYTQLGQNLNQYAGAQFGANLFGRLGQDLNTPRYDFGAARSRLTGLDTNTPRALVEAMDRPLISSRDVVRDLGSRGATGVLANAMEARQAAKNQALVGQYNQNRQQDFQIAQGLNNLDIAEQQGNIPLELQEQQAKNARVAGIGSDASSLFGRYGDIQTQLLPQLTGLNISRANLEGQIPLGTAQNMLQLGSALGSMGGVGMPQFGGQGGGSGGGQIGPLQSQYNFNTLGNSPYLNPNYQFPGTQPITGQSIGQLQGSFPNQNGGMQILQGIQGLTIPQSCPCGQFDILGNCAC